MCGKSVFIPLINIRSAAIERLCCKSRWNFRVFHHAPAIESFSLAIVGETSGSYLGHTIARKPCRVAFSGHFSRVQANAHAWNRGALATLGRFRFGLIVSHALRRAHCRPWLYNNLMPDIISYLLSGWLPDLPYSFPLWKPKSDRTDGALTYGLSLDGAAIAAADAPEWI